MSASFKLHRLQTIDSQLDRTRHALDEIESKLRDKTEIQNAQLTTDKAASALQNSQRLLRIAEDAVQAQKLKIEQTEATLYGGKVRNPKELQDLQSESEALKRYLNVLNDRLLEAMIEQEEAIETYDGSKAALSNVQMKTSKQGEALALEQDRLLQEQHRLESEREAVARSISNSDLTVYEKLRVQKRGVAVAVLLDTNCSACGSTLSSAQLHAARSPNTLIQCASCGRFLYGG